MAMNVQADDHSDDPDLNTTINTTPLVDVMLVLLIIFLVTIPVIVKTVPVQLPNCAQHRDDHEAGKHRHRGRQGREHLLQQRADRSERAEGQASRMRLRHALATGQPLPEVHIRGDKDVRFEAVGRVVLACQMAGIQKVGFLTEPQKRHAAVVKDRIEGIATWQ